MWNKIRPILTLLLCGLFFFAGLASAAGKPNILVIMGVDVGITNISACSHGLMGYQTPNAIEGTLFTNNYGEQSCSTGRSSFIAGQIPSASRSDQGAHARRSARAPVHASDAARIQRVRLD